MTTGHIKVTGVDDTIISLMAVDKLVRSGFVKTMAQAVALVTKQAKVYAPKLPNQKYVRTYKLKRGWRGEKATATRGIVANRGVPYAQYVQSSDKQAAIHAGRWNTEKDIIKQTEAKVYKLFNLAVQKAVQK